MCTCLNKVVANMATCVLTTWHGVRSKNLKWKRLNHRVHWIWMEIYAKTGGDGFSDLSCFWPLQGKSKKGKVQCAILLHLIGDEALEIYNTFTFSESEDRDKLSVLKKKFEDYVNPRKNTVFERYKFWECKQQEGETIDQFITELKTRSRSCEFGDQTDSMIRDRIVFGVTDIRLKEHLLRESSELTLEKAASLCRAAEATAKQLKEFRKQNADSHEPEVHVVKTSSKGDVPVDCTKCGTRHAIRSCPAFGKS